MATSVLTELAKELERVLPLVKALADVEVKEKAAQAAWKETEAAKARSAAEAIDARRSADQAIATAHADSLARTEAFKKDLVVRHAEASREYDALQEKIKTARLREQDEVRTHKAIVAELRREADQSTRELTEIRARLIAAKAEVTKVLTGVGS